MNGPTDIPSLDVLARDLSKVDQLSPETAKILWLDLLALEKAVAMRALMASAADKIQEDRLLGIDEAASILGKTKDWLYRHADSLPFTVREGRLLRFSNNAAQKYIRARLRHG
jgi:predicted DNA-binding transcriptional regulator AlpA